MRPLATGLRELTLEETNLVSGSGSTNVYMNGSTQVTEYFDNDGYFVGATYSRADGSGSWFTVAGDSGSWSSSGSFYVTGGYGAWGVVGSLSYALGGDTYGSVGFGTPGYSGGTGYDFDGDLSGVNLTAPSTTQATGLVVNPLTGQVDAIQLGQTGLSVTYTINLSDLATNTVGVVQHYLGRLADGVNDASRAFIQNYYPESVWNPNYQPQQ